MRITSRPVNIMVCAYTAAAAVTMERVVKRLGISKIREVMKNCTKNEFETSSSGVILLIIHARVSL